jgi:hypothetical protein
MELMFSWSALNSRKLITSRSPICTSGVAGMSPKREGSRPPDTAVDQNPWIPATSDPLVPIDRPLPGSSARPGRRDAWHGACAGRGGVGQRSRLRGEVFKTRFDGLHRLLGHLRTRVRVPQHGDVSLVRRRTGEERAERSFLGRATRRQPGSRSDMHRALLRR